MQRAITGKKENSAQYTKVLGKSNTSKSATAVFSVITWPDLLGDTAKVTR